MNFQSMMSGIVKSLMKLEIYKKKKKEIEPGCRNCHHGAVHHGADYIPKEWDKEKQRWIKHDILSDKNIS